MSYSTYEEAAYAADVYEYNSMVTKLNSISSAYNVKVNESSDFFITAGKLSRRAKAVNIAGVVSASIGFSARSKKAADNGMAKIEEAKALLGNQAWTGYNVAPAFPTGYQIFGFTQYLTYSEALTRVNWLADWLEDYSSWSFSISFSSASTSFLIDANTIATLVNLTLDIANDIGLIDDKTLKDIKSNPLWQLAINVVASKGLSYGMRNLGFTATSLGYFDKSTAAQMLSSGAVDVFNTISSLSSLYEMFTADSSSDDKQQESTTLNDLKIKEFSDTDIYATGEYYKVFAGQAFFNIALPSHDGYVPASVQVPSWGIVGERVQSEDAFMADIMNQNRNATMAGGGGYLNHITDGVLQMND